MKVLRNKIQTEAAQILNLWRMNYRTRFTGTQIGKIWIVLSPILQMGVYVFAFGFVFAGTTENPLEHVLWLICGYGPWQAISEGIMNSANSLVANRSILKNFKVKAQYLPIAASLMGLPSVGVTLVFASLLAVLSGVGFSLSIFWLLLAIPCTFLMIMGIGLSVSAVVVFLRDLVQVLSVLLMCTMFFTPILYYPERLPVPLRAIVGINPFYQLVNLYRCALYSHTAISLPGVLILIAWICAFWLIGTKLFNRLRGSFESAL